MMDLQFALFDHLDMGSQSPASTFADRLNLIEAADRLGFARYHLAEHHGTPLGLAPSPNIFLAAASQRSKQLRLCPLIFPLPLYSPLRLLEEIAMLDQISGGRLEVGVGRGGSPHEMRFYGLDPDEPQGRFEEALEILRNGLDAERLTHHGRYYQINDVPLVLRPLQQPFPPLWYGASSVNSIRWAAEQGMNLVCGGGNKQVRDGVQVFQAVTGKVLDGTRQIGAVRKLVIAETDQAAKRLAAPAYDNWYRSMIKLWRENGEVPDRFATNLDTAIEHGSAFVGSLDTVTNQVLEFFNSTGANYLIVAPAFGDLPISAAFRSLELFARDIIPCVAPEAYLKTINRTHDQTKTLRARFGGEL